jgi:hypothetical protein
MSEGDFDFEWDEFKMTIPDDGVSDVDEPCINCIGRAMCIHKTWMQVLDCCDIIERYIGMKARKEEGSGIYGLEGGLYEVTGVMIDIRSIDKTYSVHATRGKDILLIGKHWEPTVDKEGFPTSGVDMKNFKMYTTS